MGFNEFRNPDYWKYAKAKFIDALLFGLGFETYLGFVSFVGGTPKNNFLLFIFIFAILSSCIFIAHKQILGKNNMSFFFGLFGDFITGISINILGLAVKLGIKSENFTCDIIGNAIMMFAMFSCAALISYAYSAKLKNTDVKDI